MTPPCSEQFGRGVLCSSEIHSQSSPIGSAPVSFWLLALFGFQFSFSELALYANHNCSMGLALSVVQVSALDKQVLDNPSQGSQQLPHFPRPAKNVFKTNFNIAKTRSFISLSPQSTSVPMEELLPTIPSSRSRLFFHHGAML